MSHGIPIQELLTESEGQTVDFKSSQYRLDDDRFKAQFIKDILSMANSPRQRPGYIVLGVKAFPDGRKDIIGVDRHHDDADLQQLVRSRTDPCPEFRYVPLKHDGKELAAIEIPPRRRGPYTATRACGDILKYKVVYWRRGSSNDEARPDEVREISAWMLDRESSLDVEVSQMPAPRWDEFYGACHLFDDGWLYVLVIGPTKDVAHQELAALGRVDWSLVLDFDPSTEKGGTYAAAIGDLSLGRSVHLRTLDERLDLNPQRASYWVAANGLHDRPSTLVSGGWRGWNRRYAIALRDLFHRLAAASAEMPVVLVILWDEENYVRAICEAADSALGDQARMVFATEDPDRLSSPIETFQGESIEVGLRDICRGISRTRASHAGVETAPSLPTVEGSEATLGLDELRSLEEDLELVHLSVGHRETAGRDMGRDFYRGMTITWFELASRTDVDRDVTTRLIEQVTNDLNSRSAIRINLYHWPGAGGTTVGRRVAWQFHSSHPTVRLLRIRGEETIARLRRIFDLTRLPPLVLVEAADIPMNDLEWLYTTARSRQLPIVFLTVVRRFERPGRRPQSEGERTFFLGQNLSGPEAYRFAKTYGEEARDRQDQLESIVTSGPPWQKTPFYMGMVAFEEDFVSLDRYVRRRLDQATDAQKEILLYVSLAYHYAQRAVPAQLFSGVLHAPPDRPLRLERYLAEHQLELLVREGDAAWRPLHYLVAKEIAEQVLAGDAQDRRVWTQNLSSWAIKFIRLCGDRQSVSEETMDLLTRMFVLRESQELLGTEAAAGRRYAELIQHVPTDEGRLRILESLVEEFPDEPHFWGHLGRFLSLQFRDDERALAAIDHALELAPSDDVLHHMRGMVLRRQASDLMDELRKAEEVDPEAMRRVLDLTRKAGDEFQQSRELEPTSEHGHVSHIQMLLRVLSFGFTMSGAESPAEFLARDSNFRDILDEAESIYEDLRRLRQGQEPSQYVTGCQTGLDELYGDYSKVIERWTNLLDRTDIYQPPVRRQLVRAYLARHSRSWDELSERENDRILELTEQNILQEPADSRNIRMWFQAARRSSRYSIETAIEKLSHWKANSPSIDPTFYLYVLYALQALDGADLAALRAADLTKECAQQARNLPNRRYSLEWLGHGGGMRRLVHFQRLGREWERHFESGELLTLTDGRIAHIRRPEAGEIELPSGLKAFFVPGRGHGGRVFAAGADENKPVRFYLAFTYDGLSAWDVRDTA